MQQLNSVYEIEYDEFNTLVQCNLDLPQYEFDAPYGTYHIYYNVDGTSDFFYDDIDQYRDNETEQHPYTYSLLEMLVLGEILPPGTYIIKVVW